MLTRFTYALCNNYLLTNGLLIDVTIDFFMLSKTYIQMVDSSLDLILT